MTSKFLLSRNSTYIKSVFDPKSFGPVSSPDDRTVRHMVRQETITANLEASSSGGIIILYPNRTSYDKGYHYKYNGTKWVFDSTISIAQDISVNYNSGRQTACYMDLRALTQSTSNAILSGSMNAATFEGGGLSELNIPSLTAAELFNTILSSTSNPLDKVGNVYAANGISVLSVPNDFDYPYQRLGDVAPTTTGKVNYYDANNNLSVIGSALLQNVYYNNSGSQLTNVDISNCPATLQVNFVTSQTDETNLWNCLVDFYHIDGTAFTLQNPLVVTKNNNANMLFTIPPQTQPIVSMKIQIACLTIDQIPKNVELTWELTVLGGNDSGVQNPITLVVYQGMIDNQTIVVSGVSNLELVPNTQLLKQVMTKYGSYDAHEFDYFKTILGMRDSLQLRTVMSYATYNEMVKLWTELGSLDDNRVAEAFDIGSLIRGIKSVAVPALSAFFPGSAPMFNAAGSLADAMLDNITPRGHAASGHPYQAWAMDTPLGSCRSIDDSIIVVDDGRSDYSDLLEPIEPVGETPLAIEGSHKKAALFPVVITTHGQPSSLQMYALVSGNLSKHLSTEAKGARMRRGNYNIYGIDDKIPFQITQDYTALPISANTKHEIIVSTNGPVVMGSSWQAACALLEAWNGTGVFPYPLTGGVGKNTKNELVILENPAYPVKYAFVRRNGAQLIGVDMGVKSIRVASVVPRSLETSKPGSWDQMSIKYRTSNRSTIAYASDESAETLLSELGETLAGVSAPVNRMVASDVASKLNGQMTAEPPSMARTQPWSSSLVPRMRTEKITAMSMLKDAEETGVLPEGTAEVVDWLVRTGLVPTLNGMRKIDATGTLTYRTLEPLWNAKVSGGRGTPAVMQMMRAERLAEGLKMQYRGIDADWIRANNNKGPDDGQARYYRFNGILPTPGTFQASLLQRPGDQYAAKEAYEYATEEIQGEAQQKKMPAAQIVARIERMAKNDMKMTETVKDAIAEFALKHDRMPDNDEMKILRAADEDRETRNTPMYSKNAQQGKKNRSSRLLLGMQRSNLV